MAKDITQTTNNKGVAGWSLKTDDNATVDPTINWQEGQAPSTVNNSARAMMTRIREEHDLIDNRVKVIENRWGSSFLYVEINSFTLKDNKDGTFDLNLVIKDKLTDEQYADLKAGKLFLTVNWRIGVSDDLANDSVYKSITTRDVIILSLSIPTASTTHLWDLYVILSFLGTWHDTNKITLHELSYISNNIMEYAVRQPAGAIIDTMRSIPMNRSYIDFKIFEVKDNDNIKLTIKISWYYISPCEIILTVEPSGPNSVPLIGLEYFTYDLGIGWDNLTFLDGTTRKGVVNVNMSGPSDLPKFVVSSFHPGGNLDPIHMPYRWDGIRYRFHARLTTKAQQDLYPMNMRPDLGKTYPIIT